MAKIYKQGDDDLHMYAQKNRRAEEKIRKLDNSRNTELILEFIEDHKGSLGTPRQTKYLDTLRYFSDWLCKDFDKATADDLKKVVRAHINNNTELTDATKRHYLIMLKAFYKWLYDPDTPPKHRHMPEVLKWMYIDFKDEKLPNAADILNEQDVEQMVRFEKNPRNRAMMMVLFNAGPRLSEFLLMRIKDVMRDAQGYVIRLPVSKTQPRPVRITFAVGDLHAWLNAHPYKNNPDAFLWSPMNNGGHDAKGNPNEGPPSPDKHIHPVHLTHILRIAAERAKINSSKKTHPHAWRTAAVTFDARRGMNEPNMRKKYGWSAFSKTPARYIALISQDLENWELEHAGLKNPGETVSMKQVKCYNCGTLNSPDVKYCTVCHLPPTEKGITEKMKIQAALIELYEKYSALGDKDLEEEALKLKIKRTK